MHPSALTLQNPGSELGAQLAVHNFAPTQGRAHICLAQGGAEDEFPWKSSMKCKGPSKVQLLAGVYSNARLLWFCAEPSGASLFIFFPLWAEKPSQSPAEPGLPHSVTAVFVLPAPRKNFGTSLCSWSRGPAAVPSVPGRRGHPCPRAHPGAMPMPLDMVY